MKIEDFKTGERILIQQRNFYTNKPEFTFSKVVLETTKTDFVYLQNDGDRNKQWYAPEQYADWILVEVLPKIN